MKNLIFLLILSFVLLFITTPKAYAITQTSGDLEIIYENPLFPSSTIWYPGLSLTKSFTIKNLGSSLQTVSLESINTSQTGDVANVFLVKIMTGAIARYGGSNDKTMKNFWDARQIKITDIPAGNSVTIDITPTLLSTAGNQFRNKKVSFDLVIGFIDNSSSSQILGSETSVTPTPGNKENKAGSIDYKSIGLILLLILLLILGYKYWKNHTS